MEKDDPVKKNETGRLDGVVTLVPLEAGPNVCKKTSCHRGTSETPTPKQ